VSRQVMEWVQWAVGGKTKPEGREDRKGSRGNWVIAQRIRKGALKRATREHKNIP